MATKNGSRGRRIAKKKREAPPFESMVDRIFSRIERVRDAATPVDPIARKQVVVILESDLHAIATGIGTVDHFARITGQVSAAIMLCQADIGGSREHLSIAIKARDALDRAAKRHMATGKWGLDGPGLQELRDFIALREELLATDCNSVGIEASARQAAEAEIRAGNCIRYEVEAANG